MRTPQEGGSPFSSRNGKPLGPPANPSNTEPSRPNKVAVALAVRAAMRKFRKGKPIAFQPRTRP